MELPSISKITSKQLQVAEISLTSIGFLVHHRFPQLSTKTPGKKKDIRNGEMEEPSSLCCQAGLDHITHHQNTALHNRELREPARLQSYILPFSGGLPPSDVLRGPWDTQLCSRSLLYPKAVWLTTGCDSWWQRTPCQPLQCPLGQVWCATRVKWFTQTQLMSPESLFLTPTLFLFFPPEPSFWNKPNN